MFSESARPALDGVFVALCSFHVLHAAEEACHVSDIASLEKLEGCLFVWKVLVEIHYHTDPAVPV
eukprot:8608218-Heterocapsa_arctica.AAC.1